jgi:lipoate-protein ligase A
MPVTLAFLDLTLQSIEANLALDEALLIQADEGKAGAVLRLWEFPRFAVVLGASRRLSHDVRVDACREDGIPVLRRTSGGGTVLVGPGALNVTVVLPGDAAPGLLAVQTAHRYVMGRIATALNASCPAVTLEGLGDLTIHGRKFCGSAQRRLKNWFLVHCSILNTFPLDLIARYLTIPSRQPLYRAGRTHEEFLMNLVLPRAILRELICSAWPISGSPSPASDVPQQTVESLLADRFANRAWIERLW